MPRHSTHARVPEALKREYRMNYGLGVYHGKLLKFTGIILQSETATFDINNSYIMLCL